MTMCVFALIVLSLGMSCICINSPIILGFVILSLSIIISVFSSIYLFSWFGFILFLIYIGGMLVIFAYFVAIQPNQLFSILEFFSLFLVIYYLVIHVFDRDSFIVDFFRLSRWLISSLFFINNILVLILLGLVLFLALIRVVKITITSNSPLRPYNYV